jgi:hypothetical protein
MKKITFLTLVFCTSLSFAQTETSNSDVLVNKKGIAILPVKGDCAIGISASPFLEYTGNLFTDAYNPAPVFSSARPGYIYGKHYLSDNTALRAGLRIGITSENNKTINFVDPELQDDNKSSALNVGIAIGIEKYKTLKSRLRGYYGADFILTKTPYAGMDYYGTSFIEGKFSYTDAENDYNDYVEKGGNTITIGIQGVVGLEYFFAPKISVSSEFGVVLYGSKTGDRNYIPGNDNPDVLYNPGGSTFGLTTNTSSLINLFFYF